MFRSITLLLSLQVEPSLLLKPPFLLFARRALFWRSSRALPLQLVNICRTWRAEKVVARRRRVDIWLTRPRSERMALLGTGMNPAAKQRTTALVREFSTHNTECKGSYHGSVHPPSGARLSNSAGDLIKAVVFGCRSHLMGKPSYMWPLFRKRPKNFVHNSPPDWEDLKVWELPIRMRPSRARDKRTLRRSGDFMNPIAPLEFDLVKLATTISLSSP